MKNRTLVFAFSIASCSFLLLGTPASAQGSFVTYGRGCEGSVSGICANANGNTTQSPKYGQNKYVHALRVPASPRATLVDGFELLTRATLGSFSLTTRLYSESGGKPSTVLATGTMQIGSALGWYRTTFSSPVSIPANSAYYLSNEGGTSRMYFPIVPTGTKTTYFVKWSGGWAGPWSDTAWAWRVNCRQEPQISCIGVPTIGRTHDIRLTNAKPNAPAVLGIGTQRISSPWPGAPGCFLLNDAPLLLFFTTDKSGSYKLSEPVPTIPSLRGTRWPHQFAVVDPVNPASLVFSAGGEVRL